MVKTIEEMLVKHPRTTAQQAGGRAELIELLSACEQACTICADACLSKPSQTEALSRCVRINLDCALVCGAAARLLTRQTEPFVALLHAAQLHACSVACQLCVDACDDFEDGQNQWHMCAEVCRRCLEQCNLLVIEIASTNHGKEDEDQA